jgi:hypothetical protein
VGCRRIARLQGRLGPVAVRPAGRRDGAAVDLLDGTFADSMVLRLIGEGHSPGPEGDYVSLAMRPGPLCLLQLHTPGIAPWWHLPLVFLDGQSGTPWRRAL